MARINIEEKWWNDPRREALSVLLGNQNLTETIAVKLWRLSQTYWSKGELIPGHIFIHLFGAKAILEVGLARVYDTPKIWPYPDPCEMHPNVPERAPNDRERDLNDSRTRWGSVRDISGLDRYWIYANGTREHHFWLIKGYLQRVEAGKKSAERRKSMYGSAQPRAKLALEAPKTPNETPSRSNESRTTPNGPEPSSSSSVSESVSKEEEKKKNIYIVASEHSTSEHPSVRSEEHAQDLFPVPKPKKKPLAGGIRQTYSEDFELIWKAYCKYERRGDKGEAYRMFAELGLEHQEAAQLRTAVENYIEDCKRTNTITKHLCRFVKTDWREYVDARPAAQANGYIHPSTQERLNVYERWKAKTLLKAQADQEGGSNESQG